MILDGILWRPCKNTGRIDIPPHSVVRMTSAKVDKEGDAYLEVEQHDSWGFDARTFVTGPLQIPPDGFGQCTDSPFVAVICDEEPKAGEIWGPAPSSFTLAKGHPGCSIIGKLKSDQSAIIAVILRDQECYVSGQLAEDLDAPTDGWGSPTRGTMTVFKIQAQAYDSQLATYVTTGQTLEFVNRDTALSGGEDAHCLVKRVDNEWRAVWVGC